MLNRIIILCLFSCLMALAGCQAAAEPTPVPLTPAEPAPETPGPVAAACPEATADTIAYANEAHGYCLLYPAGFHIEPDWERPDEVLMLVGPQQVSGQEVAVVTLRLAFNGPAEGLDAQQYAEMWQALYVPDFPIEVEPTTVGGQPAVLMAGLPGMFMEQAALLVANGMKYRITLQPDPGSAPALTEAANEAWATVTESIVFFEPAEVPEYVSAEAVCPAETEGTRLHVSRRDGVCMLYPADFELDERFDSGFVGGPVIVDDPSFGPIRASLVFASAGPAQDETPRQALEPRLEFVELDSIEDLTIGGAPAVSFVDPRGPFASRQAMILANDLLYTIVNQPYDEDIYPEAMADVDRVWQTVVNSTAFFEPWR